MRRKMAAYAVATCVILALGVRVPQASGAPAHHAHEAGPTDRVTACGVERWAVKIGIDPDARRVNQKVVVPTTIIRLRSPPAA
jgi:hypothetical protein